MKRLKPAVAGGIFAAFVGCLLASAWFLDHFLDNYLNSSHDYGPAHVAFYGHSRSGLLSRSWDSVKVRGAGFDVSLNAPKINAHVLFSPEEDFIYIDMDSAEAKLYPDAFPKSAKDTSPAAIPNFRIPLDLRIRMGKFRMSVAGIGTWSSDSLRANSKGSEAAELFVENVSGDYLARKISARMEVAFKEEALQARGRFLSEDRDSATIRLSASRKDLESVSGDIDIFVKNPRKWDMGMIPESVSLKNIRASATFDAQARQGKFSHRTRLRTDIGEFWPLPALAADIRLESDERMIFRLDGKLSGKKSESIAVRGQIDRKLNGKLDATVRNIEAEFGPEMQPLDLSLHAQKDSPGKIQAEATTKAGSVVRAKLSGLSDARKFRIDFTGDIAKDEPWAVRWSDDFLRFNTRPQVKGSFHDGKMFADVSIAPVEYAYLMTADSLFTSLALDQDGIDFTNGFIRTKKESFTFSGDVKWNDSVPHTSWKVFQSDSGFAEAFVTFEPAIESKAYRVRLSHIPFADTAILKGLDGIVTGTMTQNFEEHFGNLDAEITTEIAQIPLHGSFRAHNTKDTVSLDSAIITTGTNAIELEGTANVLYDSTGKNYASMQLVDAWASTDRFDIPLLLAPYQKSPLASGIFSGNVTYRRGIGLQGSLQFSDLSLKNVSKENFSIPRLDVFAEKEKMQISGNISAGERVWNGDLQIDVNGLLEPEHHIFAYFTTPVGGTAWLDGDIDSTMKWRGKAQLSGSWFLPGGLGEVIYTDFKADATGDLKSPLDSLELSFHSDSTAIDTKRGFPILPVSFNGTFRDGLFDVSSAKLSNSLGEYIEGRASYNLKDRKLGKVSIGTERFSLVWDQIHQIQIGDMRGSLDDSEKEFTLSLDLDRVSYRLDKPEWGNADASARGKAVLHLPHSENGNFLSPTLEGNFFLDRALYRNEFSVDIGFGSLSKISATLSGFFTKIRRTKPVVKKTAAKSRPLNIAVHIGDSGRDTVAIATNLASIPLTLDLWVLGTSDHPLLRGDINNSGSGSIGLKDMFQFDLESLAISFQDVPWNRGSINISSVQNLPYCKTNSHRDDDETCPVHLDILGSVIAPKPMPSANCGVDDSPASLYYSVLLGCISEEESSTIDRNKVAGKLIGSVLTSTANRTLGGEYVGDIDMKFKLFNEESVAEKDSSYLLVPISLDRWVKDLSLVFGYKQDQSETPTYDHAIEAGISYIIPAFSEEDKTKNPEHYSPQLDFGASLVSKNYITATDEDESRLEKNIGFNYSYKFWSPCLFGIGKCKALHPREEERK